MAASLVLLLLVSVCAAELGFQPKRQYTYLYEAKQASGIPGIQSQWSALGMKMKVTVQVPTAGNLFFKLENVQQGELKNTYTQQPWRKSFSLPYSPVQQYQQELSKVFKVELNGGVIRKIITSGEEPIWVVNIKKSIAQMFQLDMQKHQAIDVPSMVQPSGYQSGQQADFFRVMEESIGGECETLYETTPVLPQELKADMVQELTLLSQTSLPGIKVPDFDSFHPFVVTKTKNYQNCKSRPNWQHMTPGAVSCHTEDCYLTASNRSASARYVLDGDRNNFQIQYVVAESEALMFPYGHETEQLWTVTNQTLFLQKNEKMASFIGEPHQGVTHNTLAFQYPTADGKGLKTPDLKSAPQLSTYLPGAPVKLILEKMPPTQLVGVIVQLIQKVDQMTQKVPDPVQQDVTGYILEIERALSWLSYDQLGQIYSQLKTDGQKGIYWDCLAMAGTNPTVMRLIDDISSNKVDLNRMTPILATLPVNIKTPTYQLIQQLFQLFRSPMIQSHQMQRATMALSLSNIFYQICISNTTVEHSYTQGLYKEHFCNSQTNALLKEQFIPFLESIIQQSQESERLAFIQALANTGDKSIIPVLESIVTMQKSPLEASKAIYAFYRVVAQYPEKVRKIMSPIYHDISKPAEVRVAAITMVLATNPPIAYWQKIATSTWFEPSNAVAAVIHSTYSTMANVTMAHVEPLFEMSRNARITLPLVRPPQGGYALSGSYSSHNGQFIPQYQVAAISHWATIASKTSVIPSVLYLEFQNYVNSILYSNHRWSLNMQGGQQIIDDIMGVEYNSQQRARQSPRDLRAVYQSLDSFMQSMKEKLQAPEKFHATLYAQLLGAVDVFVALDESSYSSWLLKVRQGGSWSSQQVQKITYLEDTTVTFASEIGMPVIYSKKMPMIASVRGQMSVEWKPQDGQYHVTMDNVQPFVAVTNLVTVTTINPFSLRSLGAGVENKLQLSLPMSFEATLDTRAKAIQLEIQPVQQQSSTQVKVAHIRTFPFTTAVEVNKYESLVTSSDTKEITSSHPTEWKLPFGKDVGVEAYLRLVSDSPVMSFGTFWAEAAKRGRTGLTSYWFMMESLRSRHYDVVIDTARSTFQKLQATFALVSPDGQSPEMRRPIITSQEHTRQIQSNIQQTRQMLQNQQMQSPQMSQQQRQVMSVKYGYSATATISQKNGSPLQYSSKIALLTDPNWYTQKLALKANSPNSETCLDAELAFPTLSDIRDELLRTEIKAPVWAKLGYGRSCQEHSLKMQGYVRRDELAKEYATSCPEAQRCSQHERQGNPNSADCRLAKDHAALANYYDLEFTGTAVTQDVLQACYNVESFFKYVLWPYMNDNRFSQNPSGKVNVKMQLKPSTNSLSIQVLKPYATTSFDKVQLPFNMLQEPWLLTMRKSISKKIVDSLYGVDKTVCLVDRLVVKTYDNVTLARHPSECWTLLTADSSRIRNIAVFEKQSTIRVVMADRVAEFDLGSLSHFKVDGQPQNIDARTPVTLRDDATRKTVLLVQMLSPDTIKVVAPEHYVKLIISKEGVQIHASLLAYRNRMRGVCGDFDGEEQSDLVGPSGCIYKTGQEFYDAYRVALDGSSSQCQWREPSRCIRRPAQAQPSYQSMRLQQPYRQMRGRY
ncbi:vitellogenin-1-like [Amphibalanus amphitrite]|uniref:vitellogenin-1-like n=1 Tax=Amphibalanus amphitrite TaxID=1232801 RepID=UPI001C9160D3|nr:vitellogenin-1-like [Amphibalanus amphitrite]